MVTLDRKSPETALPQLEKKITEIENTLVDRVYPVGSYYYTSKADFNPESIGGLWERENNTAPYRWRRTR